jgi:truncated hemoglobin YjbI
MQTISALTVSLLLIILLPMVPRSLGGLHEPPTEVTGPADSLSKHKSLFHRLGGKKVIGGIIDRFLSIMMTDKRLTRCFSSVASDPKRLARFKKNLLDQFCQVSGGNCIYRGRDMKTAHQGLGISDTDFIAFVEDLVKALDDFKVGMTEKNELLGALGGLKGDIVGQ